MFHYKCRKPGITDRILDEFKRDDCKHEDDHSQNINHLDQPEHQTGDFSHLAKNTELLQIVKCTDNQLDQNFGHYKNDEKCSHIIKCIFSIGKVRQQRIMNRLCC